MNKINDIETNLEIDVNITNNNDFKGAILDKNRPILKDIYEDKDDIDLSMKKNIKISKSKKNKLDTIYYSKKNKIIKLNKKNIFKIPKINLSFLDKFKNLSGFKNKIMFLNQKKYQKIVLFLIFISFILYLDKIIVENLVTSGYENLLEIKNDSGNIKKVKSNIRKAKLNFALSSILFKPFSIIPNGNIKNVVYIINGGKDLSLLLSDSLEIYNETSDFINEKGGINNIYLTNLLSNLKKNYSNINSLLYSGLNNYSKVGDLGNDYLNEKLLFVKNNLRKALKFTDILDKNYDILLSILGHNGEKKYLILFQNNDEIRPTGGFVGSTATVTIKNGKITSIDKSDIYAFEWLINKVYTDKEKAPEGLNKITGTFGLRDANYYPEIKDSSEKIKYFLDKIDYKIDGVVYINQNIILDLLDGIDGVDSEILGEKITSKNFSLILSTLVESKVFKVGSLGTPKKVLFDFTGEFLEKLFTKKDYYTYSNILLKHIESRDLIFYSFIPEENSLLWKFGVNGEINFNENFDFNYPVYTSIGGNKTDRYLEYRYNKKVEKISDSCNFKTSLDIYNSHHFSKFEDEKVNDLLNSYGVTYKKDILNIQGRGDNKSFLRIIIPKNTKVAPRKGQKVIEYKKYKIIEFYTLTRLLETSKYNIEYEIINEKCEEYGYKFFKQPGIKKYNINFDVFGEENKYTYIQKDFTLK